MFSAMNSAMKKHSTSNPLRIGSARPGNAYNSDYSKNSGSQSEMSHALRISP